MNHAAVLKRPKERRPYHPYGSALSMWRSGRSEVLLSGPANTGKSRAWLEKLHFCADKYPGMRGLICRKTRKSLTQTALVTYEQKVLPEGWLGSLIRFNVTDQQYEYPNGSILAVGGIDDPQKIMSSEWDMIYVQEATELTLDDWESLSIRCRNKVMPYQQLGGDCNPGPPQHWLKVRCDRGVTQMLISRHSDNPTFTPEDQARLDALTGVRRLRLRDGKWAAAEGMVFPEWDPFIHKVTKQQLIDRSVFYTDGSYNYQVLRRFVAGVDWGYTNSGVIQVYGIDTDGRMYLFREVYRTQRTDDWWVEQGKQLMHEFPIEPFICDPSQPAYIRKFNENGLPAIGAENAIAPGLSAMRERLTVAGDGLPRLFVYESSLAERDELRDAVHEPTCFEQEIEGYVWPKGQDGKSECEVPVKHNDHSMDCARYVCKALDGNIQLGTLDAETAKAIQLYRGY